MIAAQQRHETRPAVVIWCLSPLSGEYITKWCWLVLAVTRCHPPSCNWLPGAGRAFKYFNISHRRVSWRPSPIRLRKRSKEEVQLHPMRFIKRRRWDKWKVCTNNCTPARLPIHFLRKAFYPVFIWGQDMIYFWDEQMQIMHVEQCNVMHLNHDKNPSFL